MRHLPRPASRCNATTLSLVALALIQVAGAPFSARAQSWSPTVSAGATWESNATNANRGSDIVGALQFHTEFAATRRYPLGGTSALNVGGQIIVEAWPRFEGLDRGAAGIQGAWIHKFGLGPLAPTLALELTGKDFFVAPRPT